MIRLIFAIVFSYLVTVSAAYADHCPGKAHGEYNKRVITLHATHGFLSARKDGGNDARSSNSHGPWEEFEVVTVCGENLSWQSKITIMGNNSLYLSGQDNGGAQVNRRDAGAWEEWLLINPTNPGATGNMNCGDTVNLKSVAFNKFLSSEENGDVNANRDSIGDWERWTFTCLDSWYPRSCLADVRQTPDGCSGDKEVQDYLNQTVVKYLPGAGGIFKDEVLKAKGHWNSYFNDVCNTHDICYATDGKSKSDCDDSFFNSMNNKCGADPVCLGWSRGFYEAVKAKGTLNATARAKCDLHKVDSICPISLKVGANSCP